MIPQLQTPVLQMGALVPFRMRVCDVSTLVS